MTATQGRFRYLLSAIPRPYVVVKNRGSLRFCGVRGASGRTGANLETVKYERFQLADDTGRPSILLSPHPVFTYHDIPRVAEHNNQPKSNIRGGLGRAGGERARS